MKTPTTETRKGNPILLVVLVVLAILSMSVYSREGEAGPLHGSRRGLLFLTTPFVVVGDVVARPFQFVGDWFGGLSVDRAELETLRQQNTQMRKDLANYNEAIAENERLKKLVRLPDTIKGAAIGAHVTGRPTDSWEGTILIDRGTADSVRPGTIVVAAEGLIGQVVVAGAHSSKVRLITDQSSGVSVLVQSTRATGIVHGSVEGALSLQFYDGKQLPKVGDVLMTSGLGGAYPKGLVVGEVSKVTPDAAGLAPHIEVSSRVPISDIEEVDVLVGAQPTQVVGGVE